MGNETTDPRLAGVVLIHKQTGQPMIDYTTGGIVLFRDWGECKRWVSEHDIGELGKWYEAKRCEFGYNRPATCTSVGPWTGDPDNYCTLPSGHFGPHDWEYLAPRRPLA